MTSLMIATNRDRSQYPKPQDIRQALRSVEMFGPVSDSLIDRLATISSLVNEAEGVELYRQGDAPDALFIVLAGQLAGITACGTGEEAVVDVIAPGATLGLSSVLAQLPRVIGTRTVTHSLLLRIDAKGLLGLIEEEPSLVTALLRAEASEFHSMVKQVCDLKLRTTAQRLGCYLLSLVNEDSLNSTAMRLPFDKRLLAARLGCRQENLSRAFATLRSVGVETHGSRVILHDLAGLRAYSEPDEALG